MRAYPNFPELSWLWSTHLTLLLIYVASSK
jgi:hypothetical protein